MNGVENRVIMLTGAEGVLGQAVAAAVQAAGGKLVLVDRAPAGDRPVAGALRLSGVDLDDAAATAAAVARAGNEVGEIDALVNVAGGFAWESAATGSVETWDRMYKINLRTAVIASQAVLPGMMRKGSGRIVNVGSLAAMHAGVGMAAYAASKSGLERFTEGLAAELKDKGINVNAVLPSIIDTPVNRRDMPDADFSRWVSPQALAEVVIFLLSDAARAVTGALLPVRGRV